MTSILEYAPVLARGAGTVLLVTIVTAPLALLLAGLVAIGRLYSPAPVRAFLRVYVEFFRGTPLLIQLFWLYFALPFVGITLTPLAAGILGLTLNFGAYVSEVIRAGIVSIPRAQHEAATVLGLRRAQSLRYIVLPQTLVLTLPSLGNQLIELIKGTSLLALITVAEIVFYSQQLLARGNQPTGVFLVVAAFYFAIGFPLSLLMRNLERRNPLYGT